MTKTLYHVTPRINLESIDTFGLLVDYAKGKTRGIWLCDADRLPWAVHHISQHHGRSVDDMSILHVNANLLTLRTVRKGVFVCNEDIATQRIFDINYYAMGEPQ